MRGLSNAASRSGEGQYVVRSAIHCMVAAVTSHHRLMSRSETAELDCSLATIARRCSTRAEGATRSDSTDWRPFSSQSATMGCWGSLRCASARPRRMDRVSIDRSVPFSSELRADGFGFGAGGKKTGIDDEVAGEIAGDVAGEKGVEEFIRLQLLEVKNDSKSGNRTMVPMMFGVSHLLEMEASLYKTDRFCHDA